MNTRQVMGTLGVKRQWLYVVSQVLGITPAKTIVKGKANNVYTAAQVAQIKKALAK